jgi:glycerophosphoryl diester phosphodiesterase
MPAAERTKLRGIIETAHDAGPGAAREALWRELVAAGVDHVNTDDLHGLELFLRAPDRP